MYFYIDCPVSIVRKQENVEMLPLENIFDIARDELKNNAEEYVLDTNVKYYTLKLAYIRVNNRTDMQNTVIFRHGVWNCCRKTLQMHALYLSTRLTEV